MQILCRIYIYIYKYVTPTLLQPNKCLSTANNGSTDRARTSRHTATYPRIAQNTQNKPNFPSRGFDTIDTQDKVICNEMTNYAKIQNKEEKLENKQDK